MLSLNTYCTFIKLSYLVLLLVTVGFLGLCTSPLLNFITFYINRIFSVFIVDSTLVIIS